MARRGKNKRSNRPRLSDLGHRSIAPADIEPYADIILFAYRHGLITHPLFSCGKLCWLSPDAEGKEITEIIVAKNRNGPTGTVTLKFDDQRHGFIS
ncbi:MAG: DnaB-like helicase C-terminal domain-containing protein [Syntrophobacteraceae bacterium]